MSGALPGTASIVARPILDPLDDPGDRGVVTRIHPENGQVLDYLADHHVKPGVTIRFDGFAPLNGPLELTVAERAQTLGQEIARRIYVDAT